MNDKHIEKLLLRCKDLEAECNRIWKEREKLQGQINYWVTEAMELSKKLRKEQEKNDAVF